jgi:cysteine desulfurase/selenocysteine lyase
MIDWDAVRADFPILNREMNGYPLTYLDSAATSQKPQAVLDAITDFYSTTNANVHRGAYSLADDATTMYENARKAVARFIGAQANEIVFTRGATSAFNTVAFGWGLRNLKEDDRVLLTIMEHHANIVPWQLISDLTGCNVEFVGLTNDGRLDLEDFYRLLDDDVKLVGVSLASNVLGTINPIHEIAEAAHGVGALVVADGAQAVPHTKIDVYNTGVDWLCFSGHKMLGPTGIGALWGRPELLEEMEPAEGGGEMISDVRLDGSSWAPVPHKFEAGTPPFAQAVGLMAAIEYLEGIGMDNIEAREHELTEYALKEMANVDGLTIHGPLTAHKRVGAISFTLADIHPHDLATILDQRGVAIRAGHHCARPLARSLNVPATARASLYLYNRESDIDALIEALADAKELFSVA